MPSDWVPFELSHLLGENNTDALTKDIYQKGILRACRNFHLGRDGLLKRQGTQPWQGNTTLVNGSNALQAMTMRRFGTTRNLVVAAGGKLYYDNSGAWSDITGSLTLASGADNRLRFAQFDNGTNKLLIGTDKTNTPFKWTGSGNAAVLGGTPPTEAGDIAEFMGRAWAIKTDAGDTAVEYSDDGTVDTWSAGQVFHCTRASEGVALQKHSDSILLAFYQDSVHAIRYRYVDTGLGNAYWIRDQVDGAHGACTTDAVLSYRGYTYFADEDGIYRIAAPAQGDALPPPAEYISRPIEGIWQALNDGRITQISAFPRGRGWNEVIFNVTYGSGGTTHDMGLVFNPEIAEIYGKEVAWSIFDSSSGYFGYNCGCNYINSDGDHVTLLGGYDGIVYEGFGNDAYNTGYKDRGSTGSAVVSRLQTGYLHCGNPNWVKGLIQLEMEMNLQGNRTFDITVHGTGSAAASATSSPTVDAPGDELDTEFTFDESYLATDGITDHAVEILHSSKYFQIDIQESSTEKPHAFYGLRLQTIPEYEGVH